MQLKGSVEDSSLWTCEFKIQNYSESVQNLLPSKKRSSLLIILSLPCLALFRGQMTTWNSQQLFTTKPNQAHCNQEGLVYNHPLTITNSIRSTRTCCTKLVNSAVMRSAEGLKKKKLIFHLRYNYKQPSVGHIINLQ